MYAPASIASATTTFSAAASASNALRAHTRGETMTEPTKDDPTPYVYDICKHEWKEEYYGTRCRKCDAFYPFGCEPWAPIEEDEDDEDEGERLQEKLDGLWEDP